MRITRLAALAGAAVLVACGSPAATAAVPARSTQASPSPAVPTPSPSPSPSPSPPPRPSPSAPPPRPSSLPVYFSGLPNGTYPVHLHSACNGSQQFHITVLESLVMSHGAGAIAVPSGYFGRGLCVIVYGSPSLTTVVRTQRI